MIVGIGTDILSVGRLPSGFLKKDDAFVVRTFTEAEIEQAFQSDHAKYYFADRFAGKEAVFKALGISGENISLKEIEILNGENSAPEVKLYGSLKIIAAKKNISAIHISLSFDDDYAIAFAVAESL